MCFIMSAMHARLQLSRAPAAQHTDTSVSRCTPRSSSSWWCTRQTSPTRRARCRCAAAGARRCTRSCLPKVRARQLAAAVRVLLCCALQACRSCICVCHSQCRLGSPRLPTARGAARLLADAPAARCPLNPCSSCLERRRQGGGAGAGSVLHLRPPAGVGTAEPADVCGVRGQALLQVRFGSLGVAPIVPPWLQAAPVLALAESCVLSLVCFNPTST